MSSGKISTRLFAGVGAALLLTHVVSGQSSASSSTSCVKVTDATFISCPCELASLAFTIEGETTVEANTVNLAVVVDGSVSILSADWELEKGFAKDAVAAFASRNLFDNGGTASYVQFATSVYSSGTFSSTEDFDAFVDADIHSEGLTNIEAGIAEGRELLNATPSSASFMIVITDGETSYGGDPVTEADAARAEGTTIFAVGVGSSISEDTLLTIGGVASNVFDINSFAELDEALEGILSTSGGSVVPCPATGVTVAIEFSAPVSTAVSPEGATISGSTVNFSVDDLESSPTFFDAALDTCSLVAGGSVLTSFTYSDDQGNSPDISLLSAVTSVLDCGVDSTPSPVTPAPSLIAAPTPSPVDGGDDECAVCSDLTSAQEEALAMYDNGGKRVVCDPTCIDGVSDPSHCNYFGLGQICRGCGDCSVCTPCP